MCDPLGIAGSVPDQPVADVPVKRARVNPTPPVVSVPASAARAPPAINAQGKAPAMVPKAAMPAPIPKALSVPASAPPAISAQVKAPATVPSKDAMPAPIPKAPNPVSNALVQAPAHAGKAAPVGAQVASVNAANSLPAAQPVPPAVAAAPVESTMIEVDPAQCNDDTREVVTIAQFRSNYMAMRRACQNSNIVVTPVMLEQYQSGGPARQRLFEKFVLHGNDLAKISLDIMKDQPFHVWLFWS